MKHLIYRLPVFLLLAFFVLLTPANSHAQSCSTFYDGFESGTWSPTWLTGTGTYTRTVTTTSPAAGTYSFEHASTVANVFYQGTYTIFTPSQPGYMSWWMKTNTTTAANGYVIIGNSAIASDNGIIFCYFNATSGLRFFNTTGYNYPITANTWYHVEARNMNWTARNCDIYINGVLYLPAFAFRSPTALDIDRIHLHSLSASIVNYDEFVIGTSDPVITPVSVLAPSCYGDSTGLVDIDVTSGSGSYSYLWSSGDTVQDIDSLVAGVYTVLVTDGGGCTTTDTFSLTEPAILLTGDSTTGVNCFGDTTGVIDLFVSGGSPGYTYLWGSGQTTEDLSGLVAGTYTVMVTDTLGCMTSDTVSISEPAAIFWTDSISSPTCAGDTNGSIDLDVSGGTPLYTYLWSSGATTQDLGGVGAGFYSVMIADSLGCMVTDTFTLSGPMAFVWTDSLVNPPCNGDSSGEIYLEISGGTPGYTYMWSNGSTSEDLSGLGAGVYDVTLTDALGCISTGTYTVTDPALLTVTGLVTSLDFGASEGAIDITPSGGTPPYSYIWSNGDTIEDPTTLTFGPYTVTITDVNGCTVIDSFFVDFFEAMAPGQLNGGVTLWPNPFTDEFYIELTGIPFGSVTVSMSDIQGREVWRGELLSQPGEKLSILPVLPAGMYLVKVSAGGRFFSCKGLKNN